MSRVRGRYGGFADKYGSNAKFGDYIRRSNQYGSVDYPGLMDEFGTSLTGGRRRRVRRGPVRRVVRRRRPVGSRLSLAYQRRVHGGRRSGGARRASPAQLAARRRFAMLARKYHGRIPRGARL
jgi:hypothetical protein